jgi:hypothetical protein
VKYFEIDTYNRTEWVKGLETVKRGMLLQYSDKVIFIILTFIEEILNGAALVLELCGYKQTFTISM